MLPVRRKIRSQIANGVKVGMPAADLRDLRAAFAAEKIAEYVQRVVDEAPPLTLAQRDRLALLLSGGAPPGQVAATSSTPGVNSPAQETGGDAA